MINFIRMDLYRYFRGLSLWICLGLFTLLVYSSAVGTREDMNMSYDEYIESNYGMTVEEYEEVYGSSIAIGMSYDEGYMIKNGVTFENTIAAFFQGNIIQVFAFIIISIMICKEFTSGYIKNIINVPNHRWYNNISKLFISFLTFLIFTLDTLIVYKLVVWDIKIGDAEVFFKFIGVQMLLCMSLSALIILFSNLFKSTAFSIVFSLMITMDFITLILYLVSWLTKIKYATLSKFFISCAIRNMSPEVNGGTLREIIILGVVTFIVYTVLGMITINKQDV